MASRLQLATSVCVGLASIILYKWYLKSKAKRQKSDKIDKELAMVVDAFKSKQSISSLPTTIEFVGTIQYEPYEGYLTKSYRSFAFIAGQDGIFAMSELKEDKDKCLYVGFEKQWLCDQCSMKKHFRLLLFPKQSDKYDVIWCTWDNVFKLFKEKYGNSIYVRVEPFMNDLKTKTFAEITSKTTLDFTKIEQNGESDANYMSFDRFVSIPKEKVTLIDVRLFLYCWLHLNELFAGDGYTKDCNGNKGCKEYIIPNMAINDIPNLHVVPFHVNS